MFNDAPHLHKKDPQHQAAVDSLIAQVASLTARNSQLEAEALDLRMRHSGAEKYFSERRIEIFRRQRSSVYRLQCSEEAKADIGDVQARREFFLSTVSRIDGCERLTELHPHNGMGERTRVLLLASGGIGDCLLLTYLAKLLRSYLPIDYLAVAFEGKQVHGIFQGLDLADATIAVTHESRDSLFALSTAIDVFDLIIDVKYAAIPFFPPLSRIPEATRQLMVASGERWYRYNAFDWPHLNHHFGQEAMAHGLNAYSLFPQSLGLAGAWKAPVLDIEPASFPEIGEVLGRGKPIVCLGVGSDAKMSAANGASTKTLPLQKMNDLVRQLNERGYLTVQLGAPHEPTLTEVAADLRGLELARSAAVLKAAVCFVGAEGGLVHLAKAVSTPSVVGFGPTPVEFFGYEGNVNLTASGCTGCWWTTREWMTRCIAGDGKQSCMASISDQAVLDGVAQLAKQGAQHRPYEIRVIEEAALTTSPVTALDIGRAAVAAGSSGLEQGADFPALMGRYVRMVGEEPVAVLRRRNIPHPIHATGTLALPLGPELDVYDAALRLTDLPRLIAGEGSVVVGAVSEAGMAAIPAAVATPLLSAITGVFASKGLRAPKIHKPKKLADGALFYIVARESGN